MNDTFRVSFNDCEFNNNKAKKGGISFAFTKNETPFFSNFDDLLKNENSIVSNPTHINLLLNSANNLEIISGETIPESILFVNTDAIEKIDDIISFKAYTNDTYNTKIISQSGSYCDIGVCTAPPLKSTLSSILLYIILL
ncbi:hypothetical protein PIROE2DRAFT_61724 [Piromyces sp. E2]|nr:hypothetical protein PIROE2DRAFT_61724 [Piromyces sp. E2]|eukprot:OUM62691.1 hypothetical protein PIROE2DRAFT_61724 [Piromyces sp. E2]